MNIHFIFLLSLEVANKSNKEFVYELLAAIVTLFFFLIIIIIIYE